MQQTTYTRIEISPEDLAQIVRVQVAIALREYDRLKTAQETKPIRDKITCEEARQIAGVSRQTIYNRANDGFLTKYPGQGKLFYVSRAEVIEKYC